MAGSSPFILSFFFNDTATTEIYTLSLHDALPIYEPPQLLQRSVGLVDQVLDGLDRLAEVVRRDVGRHPDRDPRGAVDRSEEHTSELQSLAYLVCRLLLEKKKALCRPIR